MAIYKRVEPYLQRDLLTRLPGRMLRVDGTYKIMKVTMNMTDAAGENKCLYVVMGEYGHIVSFAFCDSERDMVAQRLFYFLKKRMLRLKGPEAVDKVIAVYSDTCCNNADPEQHWLLHFFPNCKRAPIKDVWHGIDLVSRSTVGPHHPLYDGFKSGLWNALLKWDKQSVDRALNSYLATDPQGKTFKGNRLLAKDEMFKSKPWRKRMKSFISDAQKDATANEVIDVYLKTVKLDKEARLAEQIKHNNYLSLFTKTVAITGSLGTKDAIDNFVEHIRKGCFSDPLPCHLMSYPASDRAPADGGPPTYNSRRGTNKVEAINRTGKNASVDRATRQTAELTHDRYMVFVAQHNLATDARIAHLTGLKARPRDWFLREALNADLETLTRTPLQRDMHYPPEFDPKDMEPIGCYYQLYDEWDRVDRELTNLLTAQVPLPEAEPIPEEDEFGPLGALADCDFCDLEMGTAEGQAAQPPVADATDGGQAQFAARIALRNESPPSKKAKPNLLGAERYGIRKAQLDPSMNRVYLLQLTPAIKAILRSGYGAVMRQLDLTATTDAVAAALVDHFNKGHHHYLASGHPTGYGGLITDRLVKMFLREMGRQAYSQQLQNSLQQPAVAQPPDPSELQLNKMGKYALRDLAKKLGLMQTAKNNDVLRDRIRKHLDSHKK